MNIIKKIDKPIRLVCHPDAFLRRWIVFPDRKDKSKLPFLDREDLLRHRVNIICNDGPSQISAYDIKDFKKSTISENEPLSPNLLITGQIPRNTLYEKGFPLQYKEDINDNNVLIHDLLVNDDQSLVANIRNKGLVIISGCAHAGIINTVNYAILLTGVNKVFAIIGGFHLTGGKMYEEAIDPTISELKKINPDYLVPCHCTGWKATNRIIQELPDKFLQPSVCTTFTFKSTI